MFEPPASYRVPKPEVVLEVVEQPDGRWTVITAQGEWRMKRQGCRTRPGVGEEISLWPRGSFVTMLRWMVGPTLGDWPDDEFKSGWKF